MDLGPTNTVAIITGGSERTGKEAICNATTTIGPRTHM